MRQRLAVIAIPMQFDNPISVRSTAIQAKLEIAVPPMYPCQAEWTGTSCYA